MKAVGKHFPKVAAKVYARHGAAWAGLLSEWRAIVGASLADVCTPEKISWPGQSRDQTQSRHQKIGGTLVIKVAYGRALEIQHTTPQIIDKINVYYGYQAVSQIKIVQGKVTKPEIVEKTALPPLNKEASAQLEAQMSDIDNDNLKHALENLAKGVLGKKSSA